MPPLDVKMMYVHQIWYRKLSWQSSWIDRAEVSRSRRVAKHEMEFRVFPRKKPGGVSGLEIRWWRGGSFPPCLLTRPSPPPAHAIPL